MYSPSVEHLACTAQIYLCISSDLWSPHGQRREPADLLAMQLVVEDNDGGWLHYQASKFVSRPRPSLGHFVIYHIAI